VDGFERVCDNLVKYGKNRAKDLELKYIFCEGYNDNEADVDGFIEIAKRANASRVVLDRNYGDLEKPLDENTTRAAQRFYNTAVNANILTFFRPAFSAEQVALIKHGM
jgi:pyruvate-formate lyase-activating enzyme